jgi:trehalose 6-phosphate synthase
MRATDLCYVASLHDGMNLVAKEFVAARDDERGVLVLSRFAGAARELTDALIVNPYSIDGSARAIARALELSGEKQASRMRSMRTIVARFNAQRWVGDLIGDATALGDAGNRWRRPARVASVRDAEKLETRRQRQPA